MNRCLGAVCDGCDRIGQGGSGRKRLVERLTSGLKKEVGGAERFGLAGTSGTDDGDLVACKVGGYNLLCDGVEELANTGTAVLLDDPLGAGIIGRSSKMCSGRHN